MTYRLRWMPLALLALLALLVAACGTGAPAEVVGTTEAEIDEAAETIETGVGTAEPLAETAQMEIEEGMETAEAMGEGVAGTAEPLAETAEAEIDESVATAEAMGEGMAGTAEPLAETAEAEVDEGMATAESVAETTVPEAGAAIGDIGEPVADLGGRTLIIGSDTAYPPMEFINDDREIVGFDVDMMNAIAELVNAEVQFETANFDAIFAALAGGEYDLVVSAVSVTEERDEIIDFSEPYLSVGQVLAVQEENTEIISVDDLSEGVIVGVQRGTTGEQAALDAGIPDSDIRRYDTIDLAFQDLATGAVDAVIADGPPTAQYTEELAGLKAVGGPFTTEDYAIALQEGDAELQEAVNAALNQLKENGILEELMEKWNLQDVATVP